MWVKLVVGLLSLLQTLVRVGQENKWIAVGEDREIAREAAKVLAMTEFSKNALREINSLSERDADDLWVRLEPGGEADKQPPRSSER